MYLSGVHLICDRWIQVRILFFLFFSRDRVSLYRPDCPGTHFVDQAGLKLRNLPVSASQVLGLKACATTAWLGLFSFYECFACLRVCTCDVYVPGEGVSDSLELELQVVVSHHVGTGI